MQHNILWSKAAQLLIISTFTLVSYTAHAETVSDTAQFTKCMSDVDLGAFKNTQWGVCYEAELVRQNKRLEQEYKNLQGKYKGHDLKLLVAAKKSWLAYREKWCRYEEMLPIAPTPYVNYSACLVDTTIEQINKIKKILP